MGGCQEITPFSVVLTISTVGPGDGRFAPSGPDGRRSSAVLLDRVVLLEGDTCLPSVEGLLVKRVLVGGGLDGVRKSGPALDVAAFRRACDDPVYDVVWVFCHGLRPAYRPAHAGLELRDGRHLTLDELRAPVPDRDAGWLLVLSSCDGAAAETAGGPRRRGLAAGAAGRAQAVVGHQWAVDEAFAATFSVLLACGLVETRAFAGAFDLALRAVRLP